MHGLSVENKTSGSSRELAIIRKVLNFEILHLKLQNRYALLALSPILF